MSWPTVSTIIPAYRANATIRRAVDSALEQTLAPQEILIVDDNSQDDTPNVAAQLAQRFPVKLIVRTEPKDGLSGAVLRGFSEARGEYLIVMDADLQHPPAKLPELLAPLERGEADFVMGSRYVPGGGVSDWGWLRQFVSRGGSWYSRIVLGLTVRDLTGGFKCFRRPVLEAIDLDAVTTNGYAFQIELTYRALRKGFRVVELPITFADRQAGGSKMSRAIVAEAVWKVPALRLRALRGEL